MEKTMEPETLRNLIAAGLEHDHLELEGDGRHFQATIVSAAFNGLGKVQQHKLVYKVLGELMREDVHALSLSTWTPEAWANR